MTVAISRIERYYDTYEVEGEEMGQSDVHFDTVHYLISILKWLFHGQKVYIAGELNLYRTPDPKEVPLCPDVVVIKGVAPRELRGADFSSYHVGVDGPPPVFAIEVASPKTWKADLEAKPALYAAFEVQEYFACDPNSKAVWTGKWKNDKRLLGWKLNQNNQMELMAANAKGQMWSEQTQSNLIMESRSLHLYDTDGKLRLTEAGAEYQRAELEKIRSEKLAAFLRTQGYNPDEVL